jgi:FtsZ-interacting cell division protein ZipA
MSDLRIILLVAGAALIVLLFAWYKWQERKLRRQGDAAFGSRHDDVLLTSSRPLEDTPAGRVEPVLGPRDDAAPPPAVAVSMTPTMTPVPAAEATPVQAPEPAAPPDVKSEPALPIDTHIDAVAVITTDIADGVDPAPIVAADWSRFSKTLSFFGEKGGVWGELLSGQPCQRIVIAMQLVDRKGPVPGMEFAAFSQMLQDLAAQHGWQLELASKENALQRAAELDRLCLEVDFQISFEIIAAVDKPFPGTRIRGIAEANGLELAPDGAFRRFGGGGSIWFTLRNRGATPFSSEHMREFSTRALSVVLDVPRVPREAFPAMRTLLNALCGSLQASLVDEQGRRLDDAALDLVADQLRTIQGRLEQNGIVPGGPLALRLFS